MIAVVLEPGISARSGDQLGEGWVRVMDIDETSKLIPSTSSLVLSGSPYAIPPGEYVLITRISARGDWDTYIVWSVLDPEWNRRGSIHPSWNLQHQH